MPDNKPVHIDHQVKERTPVGRAKGGSYLGNVVINTPGEFILTLYNGEEPIAVFNHPKTGGTFTYNCTLDKGLAFPLEHSPNGSGTKYSVTVTYDDAPPRLEFEDAMSDLQRRIDLQQQRRVSPSY